MIKEVLIYTLTFILGVVAAFFTIFAPIFSDGGSVLERIVTFVIVIVVYIILGLIFGYVFPGKKIYLIFVGDYLGGRINVIKESKK